MKAIKLAVTALALTCCSVGHAHDTAEEKVAPVMRQSIPEAPGKNVLIATVTYKPGQASAPHMHPGSIFAYVLEGTAELGASLQPVNAGQIAIFGPGQVIATRSAQGARLLVVAGRKIGEPVARRGPFVMNTEAELDQAVEDYQNGTLVST